MDISSPAVHFCSIDRVKRQYILTAVVRGRKQQLFLKTKAVPHTVGVEKRFAAGIEAASVTLSSISPCGVCVARSHNCSSRYRLNRTYVPQTLFLILLFLP